MTHPQIQNPTRNEFNQAAQRCAAAYHQVKAQLPKDALSWGSAAQENQQKAFLAFAAELPLLIDPPSFQLYLTCIGLGVAIGAIDPVDAGRFCHIANSAIAAWKLLNLVIPAAEAKNPKDKEKASGVPADRSSSVECSSPLPSKGNQSEAQASQSGSQPPETQPRKPQKSEETAAGDPADKSSSVECPSPLPSKGNHEDGEAIPFENWEDIYAATKLPDWKTQAELFKSLRDRNIDIPTDEELRSHPSDALRCCQTARYLENARQPGSQPLAPQPVKEQSANTEESPAEAA